MKTYQLTEIQLKELIIEDRKMLRQKGCFAKSLLPPPTYENEIIKLKQKIKWKTKHQLQQEQRH